MGSLAKVILIGNLGRDAELKKTPSGTSVLEFSVATNERWNDREGNTQEHTQWFRVSLWGRRADALAQYLQKGKQVYVEGRLRARLFTGNDGQQRLSLDVRADDIQLLGTRADAGSWNGASRGIAPPDEAAVGGVAEGGPGEDDEIPF